MTDKVLFELLKNDPKAGTEQVYATYRVNFINWGKGKFGLDIPTLEDTFQDAILVMFEKIRSGELVNLTCTIKTFIFSVGRNLILNRFRVKERSPIDGSTNEEKFMFAYQLSDTDFNSDRWTVREPKDILEELIEAMDDKCKKLLRLYYYRNFAQAAIANDMGYKDQNTVKSLRFRCLEKLRKNTLAKYRLEDF